MAAFLEDDWSVVLLQRRLHRRIEQWRRDPRTLVTWVGEPGPTRRRPHVRGVRADAYARYRQWFEDHPQSPERGPGGRTDFKFYVLTDGVEVTRESLAGDPDGR